MKKSFRTSGLAQIFSSFSSYFLHLNSTFKFQELLRHKEKMLMDRLHQSFRRAESQLISILEHRKGEVKVFVYVPESA